MAHRFAARHRVLAGARLQLDLHVRQARTCFGQRRFGVTVDGRVVPIDRLKPALGTVWHGIELDKVSLPVAFIHKLGVHTYSLQKGKAVKHDDDLERRAVVARVPVGFDPRALALSADGARLFVASYRSGNLQDGPMGMRKPETDQDLWVIDTTALTVKTTVRSVSADLRALALSPDGAELYVAATDGDTIPSQADVGVKSFVHQVNVLAADPAKPDYGKVLRSADLSRQASSGGPLVNPGGVLAVGATLFVAAEGSDTVAILDRATLAEKRRVAVGAGPRQLVDLGDGTVAVHCFQSFEVVVLGATGDLVARLKLTEDPRPAAIALGETVFNRPGGAYATNHACASCHVETQNDGMVWRFGPAVWHNVRPLQLLDATTPIEWGAYVSNTANFGIQGPSSIMARPPTQEESQGVAAFLSSLDRLIQQPHLVMFFQRPG